LFFRVLFIRLVFWARCSKSSTLEITTSNTNIELLKISYSKVLKFFLKDGLEVIVYKVFIIIYINLGYYIFFKVALYSILSIDFVPKSRDFLSLFRVYISGFLIR